METKRILDRLQSCIKDLIDKVEEGTESALMYMPAVSYKGYITVVNKIIPNNNNDLTYRLSGYIVKQVELNENVGLLNIIGCNHSIEIDGDTVQLDIFKDVSIVEPINNDVGYTLKVDFDTTVELLNKKEELTAEEFEIETIEQL